MAHRSQCSSAGDNPLDPNYLPPHYREEYRIAIDALVDGDLEGYYDFLKEENVVDFLSRSEIEYIKCMVQAPYQTTQLERRCMTEDVDGSSDTYWPIHSDHDAPNLDLGWPQQYRFVGPTEVTTLVNPSDPEMPSIKEQVRRMIKSAQQVIAVVMDMFTDVDIFADILGAATRGVAVYILLDELNAQHFVAMVNNCRVNLDEIKLMRVRTVSGSTYSCRTGKNFKGQMMNRFILVDCRAVLSGNYSFMWSFEKIHRCLAHLFLGQLVTTFDEEFRILFAHSEPLVVENVLANMPLYDREPEGYYNTEKTPMFTRQYPAIGMEWAERTAEEHMNVGHKMLPFRSESIHSAGEANPSVQKHMSLHAGQQYRGGHQFTEHGRQMRGPNEMVGLKRHSYGNIPDREYLPPQNHPTMRGNQYMEGAVPQGGHFPREPHIYQGAGLQSGYDMYGKFTGHHIDQLSGSGYPHEGDEAEPTGAYDHVQRYLQSHSAMEEGYGPRNVLPPVQSNIKRHIRGQSYTCQTSPTQPNQPEQKCLFNVNRKPQDMSQKQGLRDWRISSYLSAYDDAGELDLAEIEGSSTYGDIPCFTQEAPCGPAHAEIRPDLPCFSQEAPCGPVRAEIRPGNREFNRIPSPRENPMFVPDSSVNHPTVLSQINLKTTPTSTSESFCTTEGDKVDETQNREPKETNRISEEFLKRKPSRPVQRSSRLRYSLIFSSNLELNTSEDMKGNAGDKEEDEASKPLTRVSHILDKRRTSSPFQPFQWSNFVKSATFDNSATESAQPEDELNKMGESSDLDKVENSQNLQKKGLLQEKDQPQTGVPERKGQRDECPSNLLQKSQSFLDMNDADCRLRYFKELAAKRKLAAAKVSQSNPVKATQKFALPEKPSSTDADKNPGPVFKTLETSLKTKNTTVAAPEIKETCKDTKREESSKDILPSATDAEKIRFKKRLAEESGSTLTLIQKDTDPTLNPVEEARTVSTAKNPTCPILNISAQKPFCALSGEPSDPCANSSSEPCSKNSLSTSSDTPVAQVESVAFSTPLTESGLIQFHSPKETDPSHAVLTGSCPPIKLPQTTCVSPLIATQSEGCIFANDSQTLAQTSPNISGTCSNSISPDSNSKPSKLEHINNVPSPAFYTAGISSSQHPTATKADSSLHLIETVEDFSRHSTTVGSEQSAAERACSQHPSAAEIDSSQQCADSSQNHTAKESELYPKPTATGIEPLKQSTPSATGTITDSSQPSTVIESDSFQKPITIDTDISQQPTASGQCTAKVRDPSQKPTATETESSQQPTATITDSSQQPTVTETDFSQLLTATITDLSQNPTKTITDSSQQTTVTEKDSSQQVTTTITDSSQQPTVTEKDSSQQLTTTITDSSQQPTVTEKDSSKHPTATVTVSSKQPIATVTVSSQQPTATDTDSSQQPTATVTDSSKQPTATVTDSSKQPTATIADSFKQPTATVTDSSKQPTATEKDSSKQPTATVTDSSQQPTATVTDSSKQPTATDTDSSKQPTATVTDSSQQPTATVTDSSKQPTATVTDSSQQPTATVTDSSKQPTATVTDSSKQPIATVTDSSQQPTATVTDSSQQPTATVTDSSQQPTVTVTDSSKQPTATDTDSSKQPTATVTDSSQQPTATVTDSSKQPTATVTDSSKQPIATVTDSSQQPTATVTDSSQQPTATVTDSSQQPTVTVTDSSKQPTATDIDSSKQPTATVTDSSQQPTATVTDSSKQPTATVTDSSKQPIATVTDSSQQPTATVTDSSKQPTATVTDSSKQPTTTETDSFQQPTTTKMDSSQQSAATETDSSQQLTATETVSSKQPTATETDSSQQPTTTITDSSQHPTVTEKDSSKQLTVTVTDSSQQPTATVTDSSKQPTATVTDSSQQPIATVTDSSKQPTTTETDSSQQPTTTKMDSSQQSAQTEADCSQQLTATETDYSKQPTTMKVDSSQQSAATETDSSQQSAATETESSKQPTATVTDSSHQPTATETDSSQQPIATVIDSSQQPNAAVTDTSQQPSATETNSSQKTIDLSQQLTVTEGYPKSSQNCTKMMVDTSKHPMEKENESLQHTTATETDCVNEKKKTADNISKPFSKPIPDANITQLDNSVSQITVITDLSSTAEHSQSYTVSPCDSQVELNQTQAATKPSKTRMVKDTENGALNSVEVSSTQPQGSPQLHLPSNEIHTTQGITQLQSCISSNHMESSCRNDPKPEKTDECQKNETITEQSQRHEPSAIAEVLEITQTEVYTIPDNQQTAPEVENSVSNFAEVSEKSDLTIHSNSENSVIQSSVAKNPKSIMSTSTANVISCSNLRDDTKVLLEQISAKNQSRSSQSKETLVAPNEAKEGEVNSADKLFSNYSGRPWSSKATPEERELLLQKMEKMRKERKVYSRFEAS